MSSESCIIDIGNEVLRFANVQGHRKARKETIDWSRMKSHSGAAQFTTKKLKFSSTAYTASGSILTAADLLSATSVNQKINAKITKATNEYLLSKKEIYFDGDCIINHSDFDQTCNMSFHSLLQSISEAKVKLTTTLLCSMENVNDSGNAQNSMSKRNSTSKFVSCQPTLKNVSLSPKFSVKLGLGSIHGRKMTLQQTPNRELILTLPPQTKCALDIIEHKEEESGYFHIDYYLWGSVDVAVWGKRYTLLITDVLDPKYNQLFEREQLSKSSGEPLQVSKFRVCGVYECLKIFYEIKQKKSDLGFYKPINETRDRRCTCNDVEIPNQLNYEKAVPLNNQNLALLLLRIENYSHKLSKYAKSVDQEKAKQIWDNLQKGNSDLAAKAHMAASNKIYDDLKLMDKFLIVLLLWRDSSTNITDERKQSTDDLKQSTVDLVKILATIGVATEIMRFLWSEALVNKAEGKYFRNCDRIQTSMYSNFFANSKQLTDRMQEKEHSHECPVHPKQQHSISLDNFEKRIQLKLLSSLPDRVLTRLQQRWPAHYGWVTAALYLGIDHKTIYNLLSNNKSTKTNEEKLLTIFKLWRMKRRKRGDRGADAERKQCTIWDMCLELQAMEVSIQVYNFLWKDSETTP